LKDCAQKAFEEISAISPVAQFCAILRSQGFFKDACSVFCFKGVLSCCNYAV